MEDDDTEARGHRLQELVLKLLPARLRPAARVAEVRAGAPRLQTRPLRNVPRGGARAAPCGV